MPNPSFLHSRLDTDSPGFFRYRQVGDRFVVTNQAGGYAILTAEQMAAFVAGQVAPDSDLYRELAERGLIRAAADREALVAGLRQRKQFLDHGPNLHILVVTLRCNQTCLYCHASRRRLDQTGVDMTRDTAERAVDLALATTSPSVTIEFQGGEPLVNFPVVQHVIDYARDRNRALGKELSFSLVSNLSLLDPDKLAWLLDRRVQVCTSIDGPADLHDRQRVLPGASSFTRAAEWIRRIDAEYAARDLDPTLYHVEALCTVTRDSLPRWRELVDTYVDLGCRALFLRPVDPFGFMSQPGRDLACTADEFLEFYRHAVDYVIERNADGVEILERFAAIFLTKILSGRDPNYLDIRSPCGAGLGQVTYNYDGQVFTCDEGRMLHEQGDDAFLIGDVHSSYRELLGHPTVRAVALASNLDAQPDCESCAYNPYCGTCPAHNYRVQGSIFGRMRDSSLCAIHKGIQDYLFDKLAHADADTLAILERWTTARVRSHYLQPRPGP